ncbi:hypothetical protein HK101_004234 [Irineochytrium annulatum]|nr:hypothetical protein HK101_004234 [Irineochytrium annulatum]
MQQQQVPSPTADEDDIEEIYRRLRQQQQEIGVLTSAGDRLRAESAATRERFRKYEEELNKKVRAAREAAKEAKEELGRCEEEVELRGVRIVSLERELGLCNARLSHLEIELNLIRPDLQRLAECERIIENLSTRLMNRESKGSDITAEMAQRSFEMQISLEAAIQELHLANGMLK